ncbi:MAG: EAL domain-containing protein [Lachnospiraceae bacterium]|nr:EAL domain-containing protein [Lachnospiraceae bacterium]
MTDIVFLFCALILSVSCIVYFLSRKQLLRSQSKVFLWILIFVTFSAISDIISNYIENTCVATGSLYTIQYGTQILYLMSHQTLAPLYALYIMMVNGVGVKRGKGFLMLFLLPMFLMILLVATNPLTNWFFYYDANADFRRSAGEVVIYVVSGIYLLVSIYFMIRYRNAVSRSTNLAIWYFFSFTVVGVAVQLLYPDLKVELFAESISLLGVMLTVENEDEFIDSASRVYNRQAFQSDNVRMIHTGHKYAVVCLNLTNMRFYTRMLDYNDMTEVVRMMAQWLRELSKDVTVYRVTPNNLALIVLYHDVEQVGAIIDRIEERFAEGWVYKNVSLDLNTLIRVAMVPEELSEPDLLLELAEENAEVEHRGVQVQRGSELYFITRRAQVEEALKRALDEGRFEVYYQPIWDAEKDRIVSAEALLRLNDPVLGRLAPDELIPIAERNGMIVEIGLVVFEEVCAFLAEKRVKRLGLDYIEVNLSIYQLIMGNTLERFREIMKQYDIKPEQINLEITETASVNAASSPIGVINDMKNAGFTFSLDDYGTGYSNLTYIISMDFLNIKSDKGLLWDADKNKNSRMLLGDTIRMLRRLGVNVIQEGVETKYQLDFVLNAGANLIQGFYFSQPLRPDAFIDYVERFKGVKSEKLK